MATPIKIKETRTVVSLIPLCESSSCALNLANALNEVVYAAAHPFELNLVLIPFVSTLFCCDASNNDSHSCMLFMCVCVCVLD